MIIIFFPDFVEDKRTKSSQESFYNKTL